MLVLIDNYDSFSYNLYQLIGAVNPDIRVIRNNEITVPQLEQLNPSHIVFSPGPGRPADAGICEEAAVYFAGKVPLLGVCLGHQAVCEAFGGSIGYAKQLMHGKQSAARLDTDCPIFKGLPKELPVARYHSLAAVEEQLPPELSVAARTEDGEIMAVSHTKYPVFGVQFHPESILTEHGREMIENFLHIK